MVTARSMAGMATTRVLVVDDNVHAARALTIGLERCGFLVRAAHDGLSALEVAAQFRPDVVVLDIALPMFNGWELARRLQLMPMFRKPRLIAMSGLSDDVHRARSAMVGIEQHLAKPVRLEQLRQLIAGDN